MNRCFDCKFFMKVDEGYSNYTVTNTVIHCLKKHFEPTDESYSWEYPDNENDNEFFKQAENCVHFVFGDGISLDVDGETTIDDYKEDQELTDAYIEYNN